MSGLGWKTMTNPLEVVPIGDLRDHQDGSGCWCHPEIVDDEIIVHRPLDCRDMIENGGKKQ